LAKNFPNDKERPPVAHWVEKSELHDERISSERAKNYSLLVISNHPRWRVHAQIDDNNWFHEIVTGKVIGPDGYHYEPAWLHPSEAAKRGIQNGDVVTIFNERGKVLAGAYITERIMPGVIYIDHGSRYDPIIPGEFDRGGAIDTISPHNVTSKNCAGMVTSGFLAEVERTDLDQLRRKYPEPFSRPIDKGSGLTIERVLYRGEGK
jgi:anaerobic selenocysteine-containing dehydrogenase